MASGPATELVGIAQRFWSEEQIRLNARRLEHLATLGLDLERKHVLEVGGGMGDLSRFFLDRGCRVLLTDGRAKNLRAAMIDGDLAREPRLSTERLDLDAPGRPRTDGFDVVFCYGVLHLTARPERALDFLAKSCRGLLLLECEVGLADGVDMRVVDRAVDEPLGTLAGKGNEATRGWVIARLRERFRRVYSPKALPRHPAFVASPAGPGARRRGVFVASDERLDSPALEETGPAAALS